ncbi:hypothetical protein niasHT_024952 [Heterodera trifolii]|uniref:Uncharacterized protein n=1 Tax=Heterodera trifolii TaxID=157864 RepID=A0ABD2JAD0_9BILA
MCAEGGEQRNGTNINFLLEEFGIAFNSDCVIRTMFHKYFDPKEALVPNGVINRAIPSVAGVQKAISHGRETERNRKGQLPKEQMQQQQKAENRSSAFGQKLRKNGKDDDEEEEEETNIRRMVVANWLLLGPFKCSLILSSPKKTMQRYLYEVIVKFLSDGFELNQIDAAEPNISDFHPIPDNLQLSSQPKMCLQESEIEQTFTGDITKLFDTSLSSISLEHWPEAIRLYDKIGLKHEPLTLVSPAFQVPMPPFAPAIFAPEFRELAPPQLELFDLDDAFATHEIQLAQLTNRCAENELDLYIREAGEILDINKTLLRSERRTEGKITAKKVMEYVILHIVEWKKSTGGMDDSDEFPSAFLPDEIGMPIEANNSRRATEEEEEEEEDAFSNIDQYDDLVS